MSGPPNFTVTDSEFTYVAGNQTNVNYGTPHHGAHHSNSPPGDPGPPAPPQDTASRSARPESTQAPPPPQSSTAYSQESQQYDSQYQNHDFRWDPSYSAFTPNPSPNFSGDPNLVVQPTANNPNYFYPPTPAQSPPSFWPPGSGTAGIPQSASPNSPYPPFGPFQGSQSNPHPATMPVQSSLPPWALGSSAANIPRSTSSYPPPSYLNGSQAIPPPQLQSRNSHGQSDRGPVPTQHQP